MDKNSGCILAALALFLLHFAAFTVSFGVLGGDAVSGKAENGHYYVAHKGKYTEVSKTAYNVSNIVTGSLFVVTGPVCILGGMLYVLYRRFGATTGKSPPNP